MAAHNELGKLGEQIAADYLTAKGFKTVARNWHFKHKEVDIIAYDGDCLVVIEVKTRSSHEWEHACESITPSKIRFLVQATEQFVQQNLIDSEIRFDVVAVTLNGNNKWNIEHIEGAFTAQAGN